MSLIQQERRQKEEGRHEREKERRKRIRTSRKSLRKVSIKHWRPGWKTSLRAVDTCQGYNVYYQPATSLIFGLRVFYLSFIFLLSSIIIFISFLLSRCGIEMKRKVEAASKKIKKHTAANEQIFQEAFNLPSIFLSLSYLS